MIYLVFQRSIQIFLFTLKHSTVSKPSYKHSILSIPFHKHSIHSKQLLRSIKSSLGKTNCGNYVLLYNYLKLYCFVDVIRINGISK